MPKGNLLAIGFLLLCMLTAPSFSSPSQEPLLEGALTLTRQGEETGTERFVLARVGEGYLLVLEGSFHGPKGGVEWAGYTRFLPDFTPAEYELEETTPGGTTTVRAEWGTRQRVWTVGIYRDGERVAAATFAGEGWVLLDRDVVSHYVVLALVLFLSHAREFTALVPRARVAVPLYAEASGLAAFHAHWGEEVAQRWRLSLGGTEVLLYEHAGELLWTEVPEAGLSAWRSDLFPEPPSPYRIQKEMVLPPGAREEEVGFPSGEVELAGTFLLPGGEGPFPAVLFIPGTGRVNRDGSAPDKPAAIFRELAYSLAEVGFASLRYDKRGVGKSGGDLSRASMSDLLADADAALWYLRSRSEVKSVLIVGHSEGAVLAPKIAGIAHSGSDPSRSSGAALPGDLLMAIGDGAAECRGQGGKDLRRAGEARGISRLRKGEPR